MSRKKRVREKSRHLTDDSRGNDGGATGVQSPQDAIFERAVDEAIAGLPFEEGGGFSYVFWRIRAGKPREYCGRYMPPPDLDLWHRELGAGDYQIQVQQHGKFTDFPAIKLTFGDRPGVQAPAAPSPSGQAGQAMQEILGLLKDRAAVEAAKAAISEKQESFGPKEMLEMFTMVKNVTPDPLLQMKAMVDLLGLKNRGEAPQERRNPYDEIVSKLLSTIVERGVTGGGGSEPSIGVEVVRALLNPDTVRELGRTIGGTIAIATGKMRPGGVPSMPPAPSGEIPPPVSEQPTTGEGPQRGFDRLVQEILVMVQAGDKDFDHIAACADRWTPGLCEQIAAAEKEAAVAHIVQSVPPLNTPQTIAWLNEFYDYLKRAEQEGGPDAA